MTWLIADSSNSAYIYQLTDNCTFWECTKYPQFSHKIRERLYARILRLKRCTMFDCESLHFLLSDRNSIQASVI
jgi:hypothetical protein